MIEVPTHAEIMEVGKDAALLRTKKLHEGSFAPGFMPDVINGLVSAVAEEAIQIALQLHRKTFFSTAAGADLDDLADDHFTLARQKAVAAKGIITYSRPTTAGGNLVIPAGTEMETADGIRFKSISTALMAGVTATATIQALVAGDGGNVAASTITKLVSTLTDATITISNVAATAGGIDAETDAAFRQRIRGYLATVRRGTKFALEFGAKSVAGVVQASVDESTDPPTVYIADVTGGSNQALTLAVQAELDNWRSAGIQVNVLGATVVQQPVDVSLTFVAGVDTEATKDAALAAILAYVNGLGISETLFKSQVIAAASVSGILDVTVNNPAGDVVPAAAQLIRTTQATVTAS